MTEPGARILVAYASKNGSTAEIAEAIAAELRAAEVPADCREAGEVRDLDGYSGVVLGSAVYAKRWQRNARRFLRRHSDRLARMPFWVFSSGPCGENPDPAWCEPPRIIEGVERLGVREHVIFGGRLPLEPSNFVERAMLKNTPPELHDCRDWDEIRAWARGIAASFNKAAA